MSRPKEAIEKLHAIQSLRLTGRMRVQADTLELGYVTLIKQPGSIRYEASLQGLTQCRRTTVRRPGRSIRFRAAKIRKKSSRQMMQGTGRGRSRFHRAAGGL